MTPLVLKCLLLFLLWISSEGHSDLHRQFQYNSLIDERGTYNFAYDTSHQPSDAHSLHMEYRDANGIVRGRYGYTDPRGNLRIVEYEAGPDGFKARGDVGPDLFPHMEAPGLSPQKPNLKVTPLRMAGWDPVKNPISEGAVTESEYYSSYSPTIKRPRRRYITQNRVYRRRPSYPSRSQSPDTEVEVFQQDLTEKSSKPLIRNEPLTIYNIDVDPDEIRVAGPALSEESQSSISFVASPSQSEAPTSSPQYYEESPRINRIIRYDDSYPRSRVVYDSYGQRIKKPRPVTYNPQPHYHGQQYNFE